MKTKTPSHTPEPWTVQEARDMGGMSQGFVNVQGTHTEDNLPLVARFAPVGRYGIPRAEAECNAARAVQCVNACAGIPDPAAALDAARAALETAIRLMDLVLVPGRHDPIEANGYSLRQAMAMLSPPP